MRSVLMLFFLISPSAAMAYVDPFTGSMLVQGLIAGFFAAVYFIRMKWYQIKRLLGIKSKDSLESVVEPESKEPAKD